MVCFRICFLNEHVGHAQPTIAIHNFNYIRNPRDYLSLSLVIQESEIPTLREELAGPAKLGLAPKVLQNNLSSTGF